MSDTEMRLAEAVGLHMDDLKTYDDIPYVELSLILGVH